MAQSVCTILVLGLFLPDDNGALISLDVTYKLFIVILRFSECYPAKCKFRITNYFAALLVVSIWLLS